MISLSKVLLGCSLAVNVGLAAVLLRGVSDSTPSGGDHAPAPVAEEVPTAPQPTTWDELQGEDLKEMAQRLETQGFPPEIVRGIIAAQVRAQFAERRRALQNDDGRFWISGSATPENRAALRALQREETEALRAVLGTDDASWESKLYLESRGLSFVAPERAADVRRILRNLDQSRADLIESMRTAGGLIGAGTDFQQKMRELERSTEAELAGVLSPEELDRYRMANSQMANQLRYELSAFNPTEAEFRAILKLREESAADLQGGLNVQVAGASPEQRKAREQAQQQFKEQLKLAIGPERAAAYERATDFEYRTASQLMTRLNLPQSTADDLYAVQQEFRNRQHEVLQGVQSRDDAIQRMVALREEALQRVKALLGTDANVSAYQQYGGNWLRSMTPRPPPAGGMQFTPRG